MRAPETWPAGDLARYTDALASASRARYPDDVVARVHWRCGWNLRRRDATLPADASEPMMLGYKEAGGSWRAIAERDAFPNPPNTQQELPEANDETESPS